MKNKCVTGHHAAHSTVPPIILHIIVFLEVPCIRILILCFSRVEILKYTKAAVQGVSHDCWFSFNRFLWDTFVCASVHFINAVQVPRSREQHIR